MTKNVGSYCVRVGSVVQTDATSPSNVRTCTASWEVYNPYDFINSKTMLNARSRPEQCWKSYANGSNVVALRFGDQGTKEIFELLARKFGRFQTLSNNSQQHATTCNKVSVFFFLIMPNKSKSKPSSDVLLKEILLHCFVEPWRILWLIVILIFFALALEEILFIKNNIFSIMCVIVFYWGHPQD